MLSYNILNLNELNTILRDQDFLNSLSGELLALLYIYYSFPVEGLKIHQAFDEVEQLADFLEGRKFNNFYEVGSAQGGSFWLYSMLLCNGQARVTAIDWEETPALHYVKEELIKRNRLVSGIKDKSTSIQLYGEPDIDLLHIDGGHAYDEVRADFNHFLPMMAKDGIIILHDTLMWPGCIEFRKNLESIYETQTFKGKKGHCGITVVKV